VFGKVVGGLDVLTAMEKTETNDKDKPLKVWLVRSLGGWMDARMCSMLVYMSVLMDECM
jgi:hypothetical protein